MDSNSLDKTLNFMLNTLPRTVAPLGAVNKKQKFDKKFFFKLKKTKTFS